MNYVGSLDGEADKIAGDLGCSSTFIVLSFVNNYYITEQHASHSLVMRTTFCDITATLIINHQQRR